MKNLVKLTTATGEGMAIKPSKIFSFETLTAEVKANNPGGRCFALVDNDDADGRLSGMILADSFARLSRLTSGAGERVTLRRTEGIKLSLRPDDVERAVEVKDPETGEMTTFVLTRLVLNSTPPQPVNYAVCESISDIMEMVGEDDEEDEAEDAPFIADGPAASGLADINIADTLATDPGVSEMVPVEVTVAPIEEENK